jgi:hypothetical protein
MLSIRSPRASRNGYEVLKAAVLKLCHAFSNMLPQLRLEPSRGEPPWHNSLPITLTACERVGTTSLAYNIARIGKSPLHGEPDISIAGRPRFRTRPGGRRRRF